MTTLSLSRTESARRHPIPEEGVPRTKAASSCTLPCPPDSRRRVSRDTMSRSLGNHEYQLREYSGGQRDYAERQFAMWERGPLPKDHHGARDYRSAREAVAPEGYYYHAQGHPEHPYSASYTGAQYAPVGYYWKEAPPGISKPREAIVTQVGMMCQAGDVPIGSAPAKASQSLQATDNRSPERSSPQCSPAPEDLNEESRSAADDVHAETASQASTDSGLKDDTDGSSGSNQSGSAASFHSEHEVKSDQSQSPLQAQRQVPSVPVFQPQVYQLQQEQMHHNMIQREQEQQQQAYQSYQQKLQEQQFQRQQSQQQLYHQQLIQQQMAQRQNEAQQMLQQAQDQQYWQHQQAYPRQVHLQPQQQRSQLGQQSQYEMQQSQHQSQQEQQQGQPEQQQPVKQAHEQQTLPNRPATKGLRVSSIGRVADPVPPPRPPSKYGEPNTNRSLSSHSGFSVSSVAAPLLPNAKPLGKPDENKSLKEQACVLVNIVLCSVLTGIVAALIVRRYVL